MPSTHRKPVLPLAVFFMGLFLACGNAPQNEGTDRPSADQGGLPPGHPSTDGQGAVVPAPPTGSGTGASELTWDTPDQWIQETPSSRMRRAQYRAPGEAGDAECVVFYFGPGQGGDAPANALRWANQFEQADGRSSTEVMETRTIDVNGVPVMLIEVTGTYHAGSMMGGSVERKPDYMLLGAIAEGPDANWFFKFTGPETTVRANQEAFNEMVHSLQSGQ